MSSVCHLRIMRSSIRLQTGALNFSFFGTNFSRRFFSVELPIPPKRRATCSRLFSTAPTACCRESNERYMEKVREKSKQDEAIASLELFEETKTKNRETFKNAIDIFNGRDHRRRGAVEFIYAALKNMKQFGVHKDLETYKALIDVMPKGQYVPENLWQADFRHYPKQQDCIVKVLTQMELNRVVPDEETGELIQSVFGVHSAPFKKYMRMCYWLTKFKNASPWPLPNEVPNDPLELAKMAISRITSVDRLTEITIYDANDIPESIDKTWIVSGQSPDQKEMITKLPKDKALYVEGGFRVWLREAQVTYYILRGEPPPAALHPLESTQADIDDVSNYKMWIHGEMDEAQDLVPIPNVHEQADGSILACCATGTSTRDTLLSWVRFLQRDNQDLENIPILFTLHSPLGPVVPLSQEELNIKKT